MILLQLIPSLPCHAFIITIITIIIVVFSFIVISSSSWLKTFHAFTHSLNWTGWY
jgi:hypothetical protein